MTLDLAQTEVCRHAPRIVERTHHTFGDPLRQVSTFGWGTVTDVRKDLGVFVDTGLPDKQIVVSLDILPEIKELWPKKRYGKIS